MKVEHASVCPLDCPDTCSLTVTVDDSRIVGIRGSRANPYTDGVICAKVPKAYPEFVHGDRRLRTPLKRVGAKGEARFERISWDEALDIHLRAYECGYRRARTAGRHAAELWRAARAAGRRLDGPALLPSHGRQPARPQAAVRRHPHRGVGRDLRHGDRHQARADRGLAADRGVGQQRHVVEPAHHAADQSRPAGGRQAGGCRSAPHQDRRAGRSAPGPAPRHRRGAGVGGRRRSRASRCAGPRVHRAVGERLRGVHGAGAAVDDRAGGRDVRAGGGRRRALRRVVRHDLAGLHHRGQRARAQPQRRQRHPGGVRAARAGRQVRSGRRWPHQRRVVRVSQDAAEAGPARPGAARYPHAQHRGRRHPPHQWNAEATAQGPVHLQPQRGRGASRSEPDAARAEPGGSLHRRHRGRDDRHHAVLRRRAAGVHPLRASRHLRRLWPALAAARRAGDPAAGRGAVQHGDLPAPGRALRLHRAVLQGHRRRADRRRRSIRPT